MISAEELLTSGEILDKALVNDAARLASRLLRRP